jgi:hypothetical protein
MLPNAFEMDVLGSSPVKDTPPPPGLWYSSLNNGYFPSLLEEDCSKSLWLLSRPS